MVAVAASPTPGAATAPFSGRPQNHPPYKDMILSALEALKGIKGTSRHALSKYISNNYPDLPPTHSSLLSHHLRRLQSKGVIRMSKHSYKLADVPVVGTKKRGRPRKNPPPPPAPPGFDRVTKRRGRPPKTRDGDSPAKKKGKAKEKMPEVLDPAGVFILPQAEQLKSGFLQSLPGAVAIVLPEGLLSKKTAKGPVLILPNGVQSLVDVSVGKKKLGRPRKKAGEEGVVEKRRVGVPRRKFMLPKQVLFRNGEHVSVGGRKVGRPRKIRENGDLKTFDAAEAEQGNVEKEGNSGMPETGEALVPEVKKRLVGRPKKIVVVEAPKTPLANDIAS